MDLLKLIALIAVPVAIFAAIRIRCGEDIKRMPRGEKQQPSCMRHSAPRQPAVETATVHWAMRAFKFSLSCATFAGLLGACLWLITL